RPQLVDLGAVSIDVDQLGVGGKGVQLASGPGIQTGTNHQQQVTLIDRLIRCSGTVHAEHAQVVRVVLSGVTDALERYNAGHSRGVCKGAEALFSAGQRDPAAAVEQGAFGGAQQSHGTGDIRT